MTHRPPNFAASTRIASPFVRAIIGHWGRSPLLVLLHLQREDDRAAPAQGAAHFVRSALGYAQTRLRRVWDGLQIEELIAKDAK